MAKIKLTLDGYRCERCGHEWVKNKSTVGDTEICPKCKSASWYKPRPAKTSGKQKESQKNSNLSTIVRH